MIFSKNNFRLLLAGTLTLLTLSACKSFDGDTTVPAYIHLDHIDIVPQAQNAPSVEPGFYTSVVDAVQLIGYFEGDKEETDFGSFQLPFTTPVLRHGTLKYLRVYPVIKQSGQAAFRVYYTFYQPTTLYNIPLSPDSVTIFASREKLDSIHYVYTRELNYSDILLTPHAISALANAFRKQEEVSVTYVGSHVIFEANDIRFTVVAPEGRFPNYNSVIPTNQPYSVTVNKKEIIEALKRINVFANANTNAIWMRSNGMLLTIGADDIDYSRASSEDVVLNECTLPEGYKISANVTHLLRLFSQVSTENIRILFADPRRAYLVKDDDDNTPVTQLGMPMIL